LLSCGSAQYLSISCANDVSCKFFVNAGTLLKKKQPHLALCSGKLPKFGQTFHIVYRGSKFKPNLQKGLIMKKVSTRLIALLGYLVEMEMDANKRLRRAVEKRLERMHEIELQEKQRLAHRLKKGKEELLDWAGTNFDRLDCNRDGMLDLGDIYGVVDYGDKPEVRQARRLSLMQLFRGAANELTLVVLRQHQERLRHGEPKGENHNGQAG
jgi:hypothetical protein